MEHFQELRKSLQPYEEITLLYLNQTRTIINDSCQRFEPWQLLLLTSLVTWFLITLNDFIFNHNEGPLERLMKTVFRWARKIPPLRNYINRQLDKASAEILHSLNKPFGEEKFIQSIPSKGLTETAIVEECRRYNNLGEFEWNKAVVSGTVYGGDKELTQLAAKVYDITAWTNPLHADVFPGVRRMEAEVVRMACNLFNGDPATCGVVSNGGTESLLLAVLAARNRAYENGIKHPHIIVPVTAHAAFDKAVHLFDMKITHVPVDPKTLRVVVSSMKSAITKDTCLLVGSAPQYPHGAIDSITEIGKLGIRYGIPVHVDACLGGFIIVFMKKAGFDVAPFDFTVPGVWSISADTHKYGYAPKGSSVVLFKDTEYRRQMFFAQPNWPGGVYASPTLAGSRAGSNIATCWATMMYYGLEGYVSSTKKILTTKKKLEEGIRAIEHIKIMGSPDVTVIAIGSDEFDAMRLFGALGKLGWSLNPLQFPAGFHICITRVHTQDGFIDRFLTDMKKCVDEVMKDPKAAACGSAAVYGMAQMVPDRSLISNFAHKFIDACYDTGLPEKKKSLNGVHKQ